MVRIWFVPCIPGPAICDEESWGFVCWIWGKYSIRFFVWWERSCTFTAFCLLPGGYLGSRLFFEGAGLACCQPFWDSYKKYQSSGDNKADVASKFIWRIWNSIFPARRRIVVLPSNFLNSCEPCNILSNVIGLWSGQFVLLAPSLVFIIGLVTHIIPGRTQLRASNYFQSALQALKLGRKVLTT